MFGAGNLNKFPCQLVQVIGRTSNAAAGSARADPAGLGDWMSDLDLDTEQAAELMGEIGDVLVKHLGVLPNTVLVLHHKDKMRTFFGGDATDPESMADPYRHMRRMLGEALAKHNQRHPQ